MVLAQTAVIQALKFLCERREGDDIRFKNNMNTIRLRKK